MKQVEHDNILPFYGVWHSGFNIHLVFPWCENGDIMDYLKHNLTDGRHDLASAFSLAT